VVTIEKIYKFEYIKIFMELTQRTQVLYQDADPTKEGVTYVAIDTNSYPPYAIKIYSYKNGEIESIRATSPQSLLILDLKTATRLFEFKKEKLDRDELGWELDRAERKLKEEEKDRKLHTRVIGIGSAVPVIYLGNAIYNHMINNNPHYYERVVDLVFGMALGAGIVISFNLYDKATKKVGECKRRLKDLENQLLENSLEE